MALLTNREDFVHFWNNAVRFFGVLVGPLGIVFNIGFLVVLVRVKSVRTVVNVYLANLAVADTVVLLYFIVTQAMFLGGKHDESSVGFVFQLSAVTASSLFVTAVAIGRFSAVRRPLTSRTSASKKRAGKISALLWTFAVVNGLATLSFTIKKTILLHLIYSTVRFVYFFIGLTINMAAYVYIIVKLSRRPIPSPKRQQVAIKVARMLAINSMVFYLLVSVNILTYMLLLIGQRIDFETSYQVVRYYKPLLDLGAISTILTVLNSCINPLVYSLTNGDFRTALQEAFPCLVRLRRASQRCLALLCRRRRRRHNRRRRCRQGRRGPSPGQPAPVEGPPMIEMTVFRVGAATSTV